MASGTSFWKVFLGVLLALAIVGACGGGACLFLLGGVGKGVRQAVEEGRAERDAARQDMTVSVLLEKQTVGVPVCRVKGSITNDGKRAISLWRVKVRFLDDRGTTTNTESYTGGDTIGPNERKTFDLPFPDCSHAQTVTGEMEDVWLAATK